MKFFPAILFLLIAIGLSYLSLWDRTSVTALAVVEAESKIGFPIFYVFTAIGFGLLVKAFMNKPKVITSNNIRQRQNPIKQKETSNMGKGWLDDIIARSRSLPFPQQARILMGTAPFVPFTLVLENATPEQMRRASETFVGFISSIPAPKRARISLRQCPINKALKTQIEGFFKRGSTQVQVTATEQQIDIIFTHPDPRWEDHRFIG